MCFVKLYHFTAAKMRATVLDSYSKYCFLFYFSLFVCLKKTNVIPISGLAWFFFFPGAFTQDQSSRYWHTAIFHTSLFVVKASIPDLDASPSQLGLLSYTTPQRWHLYVLARLYWWCYDNQIAWELWTSSKQPKRSGFRVVYHRHILESAFPPPKCYFRP